MRETGSNLSSAIVHETCSVSCSGWMTQNSCCPSLNRSLHCCCWLLFELLIWTWRSASYLEAPLLLCSHMVSVHSLVKGSLSMQGCSAESEGIAIVSKSVLKYSLKKFKGELLQRTTACEKGLLTLKGLWSTPVWTNCDVSRWRSIKSEARRTVLCHAISTKSAASKFCTNFYLVLIDQIKLETW